MRVLGATSQFDHGVASVIENSLVSKIMNLFI